MGGRALRWVLLTYAWLGCSTSITSVSTTSTTHAIEHVDAVASCSAPDPNVSLVGAHFDIVSVPWYPLTVVRNGSFVGIYDQLLAAVAFSAGFTYTQRLPRNGTQHEDAVDELARGEADFAWGAFAHTSARGARVDLTSVLRSGGVRIATPRLEVNERALTAEIMLLIFSPFSGSLWLVIVVLIIGSALVMYSLENVINKVDYERERGENTFRLGALKSVYLCFMALNAGPSHEPIQWSVRLIKLGWAAVSTVLVSTFTANLVAIFTTSEAVAVHAVNDMADFGAGARACVLARSATAVWLAARHPQLVPVTCATAAEAFARLDARECAGLVATPLDTIDFQMPSRKCAGYDWVGAELSQVHYGALGRRRASDVDRLFKVAVERVTEHGELFRATERWLGSKGLAACSGVDGGVAAWHGADEDSAATDDGGGDDDGGDDAAEGDSADTVGLLDLAGPFVFYGAVIAVFLAVMGKHNHAHPPVTEDELRQLKRLGAAIEVEDDELAAAAGDGAGAEAEDEAAAADDEPAGDERATEPAALPLATPSDESVPPKEVLRAYPSAALEDESLGATEALVDDFLMSALIQEEAAAEAKDAPDDDNVELCATPLGVLVCHLPRDEPADPISRRRRRRNAPWDDAPISPESSTPAEWSATPTATGEMRVFLY